MGRQAGAGRDRDSCSVNRLGDLQSMIFFDVDGTLVHSIVPWDDNHRTKLLKNGYREATWGYYTKARPHAKELLEAFPQARILTSGGTDFQRDVLRVLELPVCPERVYGRGLYEKVPQCPDAILVDDLWLSTLGVQQKLEALGFTERNEDGHICTPRFVNVKVWSGQDGDTELVGLVGILRNLIGCENGTRR
jgi:hypothetical protein